MTRKVVLFDLETAPILGYVWSIWNTNMLPENIVEDWSIICIGYRELGKNKVRGLRIGKGRTERDVVAEFREYLNDVDTLVAHNCDGFDIKRLTAKLIEYRLPPLPKLHTVDTLKEVKKVSKWSSHRLDYLCQKLFNSKKKRTEMSLWRRCMAGVESALKEMMDYCKHDIVLLEELYLELRPYMKGHPNMADVDTLNCTKCNSTNTRLNKVYVTKAAGIRKNHFQCLECGSPFTMAASHKSPRPLSVA